MTEWKSACCEGEICNVGPCIAPAVAKVEEAIFSDDPARSRHPLTAYLCREHFGMVMGEYGIELTERRRAGKNSPLPLRNDTQ